MRKAPYDLRDYALGELNAAENEAMASWLEGAPEAREQVERMQATLGSLRSAAEEEPPRRIAFVSDKIFEPSRSAGLWRRLWAGSMQPAFGAALVLAVLFGGVWATEPVVRGGEQGWTLSFGAPPPTVEAPPAAPAGLDEAGVRAVLLEVIAASEARQREVFARLTATSAAEQTARNEAALADVRTDSEAWFYLYKNRLDEIEKGMFGYGDLAAVRQ